MKTTEELENKIEQLKGELEAIKGHALNLYFLLLTTNPIEPEHLKLHLREFFKDVYKPRGLSRDSKTAFTTSLKEINKIVIEFLPN